MIILGCFETKNTCWNLIYHMIFMGFFNHSLVAEFLMYVSIETLPHFCNENIGRELRISYDDLTEMQKHAFLDIACFFRSEEEDYVKHLLDTNSGEAGSEV